MLRSTLRILLRFRWPLVVALVVFLVLYNVLQPRPVGVYRLPVMDGMPSPQAFLISPTGRYAVVVRYWRYEFYLYDLANSQFLFSKRIGDHHSIGFDADDGLAFVSTRQNDRKDESWLQFHYWRPGTDKPTTVYEQKIEPSWKDFIDNIPNDAFMLPFLSLRPYLLLRRSRLRRHPNTLT